MFGVGTKEDNSENGKLELKVGSTRSMVNCGLKILRQLIQIQALNCVLSGTVFMEIQSMKLLLTWSNILDTSKSENNCLSTQFMPQKKISH